MCHSLLRSQRPASTRTTSTRTTGMPSLIWMPLADLKLSLSRLRLLRLE
jgi:hypothetical protein